MFIYIEVSTQITGKLACTQVKSTWLLPTCVSEVNYDREKDTNFKSASTLKEELNESIDDSTLTLTQATKPEAMIPSPTAQEIDGLHDEHNKFKVNPVCLSLVQPHSEQFVCKSRKILAVTELYDVSNTSLEYVGLIKKFKSVEIKCTDWEIEQIEDTRKQAKSSGFHNPRAGKIEASVSRAVYHSDVTKPSQPLIKIIVYPSLYNLKTKAIQHGVREESNAVKAYGEIMKSTHKKFTILYCGVIISKEHSYIHATLDFLSSCDCCGLECGYVKCPLVDSCDFDTYIARKYSCLDKAGNTITLKQSLLLFQNLAAALRHYEESL